MKKAKRLSPRHELSDFSFMRSAWEPVPARLAAESRDTLWQITVFLVTLLALTALIHYGIELHIQDIAVFLASKYF